MGGLFTPFFVVDSQWTKLAGRQVGPTSSLFMSMVWRDPLPRRKQTRSWPTPPARWRTWCSWSSWDPKTLDLFLDVPNNGLVNYIMMPHWRFHINKNLTWQKVAICLTVSASTWWSSNQLSKSIPNFHQNLVLIKHSNLVRIFSKI